MRRRRKPDDLPGTIVDPEEAMKGPLLWSFVCLFVAAAASAQLTSPEEQDALDGHNQLRSEVASGLVGDEPTATNMVKLGWDDDLAEVAHTWVSRCSWGHNANRTAEYGALHGGSTYVGENLAVYLTTGSNHPDIVDFALSTWSDEVADYSYGPFASSSVNTVGHYTQMVWANTHFIGCGLAVCPGSAFGYPGYTAYYLGCDYAQGGNYVGQYPYEAGPTASHCPTGYPQVENGLCAMPEPDALAGLGSGALLLTRLHRRRH
jgi:hypothetical protein